MKKQNASFLALSLLLILFACDSNKKTRSSTNSVDEDLNAADVSSEDEKSDRPVSIPSGDDKERPDNGSSSGDPGSTSGGTAVANKIELPKAETCDINPDYDPSAISCSISLDETNSIWSNVSNWNASQMQFKDRNAKWISPLTQQTTTEGFFSCPELTATDKLIYTTSIVIENEGSFNLEILNDNSGTVRLWKNGDPNMEVANLPSDDQYRQHSVDLAASQYAIVVTSKDEGVASAVVFSMTDSDEKVVKRSTEASGDWCIFRVPENVDEVDYVRKAGKCRKCLIGPNGK